MSGGEAAGRALRSIPTRTGLALRRSTWAGAVAALILVGGCASEPSAPESQQPPVNLTGYSPAFKKGFQDGCHTAQGKLRRDEPRYQSQQQYAQGWEDGRAICAQRR